MPASLRLTIPRVPKSPNQLRGRHWSVKHRDRQDWADWIRVAKFNLGLSRQSVKHKVRAHITVFYLKHPMDPDNLHGSLKPCFDAMKQNNLLVDDSSNWLEYSVSQSKVATKKECRTEIQLEEA